jgi:DNA-binding GntR family transcriptional regulator
MVTSRASATANAQVSRLPELILDRASPIPLYFQIAEQLKRSIEGGQLPPKTMLGNEIELADHLAVSRPTFRKAIEQLVELGLVARRRGVGTVVVPHAVKRRLAVPSLYQDLLGSGRKPSTQVIEIKRIAANAAVAAALDVSEGSPVLALKRLRLADQVPLGLMRNFLPADLIELSAEELGRRSLYELLQASDVRPHIVNQTIGSRLATLTEARQLEIKRPGILFTVTAHAYGVTGRPIDYGIHAYRADLYSFEISHVMP